MFSATLLSMNAQGQTQTDWVEMMQDPSVNFYQVQQAFEDAWADQPIEKGKGYKQYKRWEAFMKPRVYPSGERPSPDVLYNASQYVAKTFSTSSGTWKPLGPFNGNAINGIGRVNRMVFHPTNSQIVYACTAAGGLWKSVDGGNNWTTNTDQLTNIGSSDLLIDHSNTDIMYLATGDRDGGDTYSFGVLKSTDGGATWQPSGLSFAQSQAVRISDLYMHPSNSDIIIASTRSGIYRSTDAGTSWISVQSGVFNEVIQKPGNPQVLYVSSIYGGASRIYRSTNNGISWTQLSDPNLPTSGVRRIEIAVTPADSNYVYALMGASDNGFYGLYRSTDGGDTWTQRSNSPNLMGWSTTGNDAGGQAWYDLSLAVDPSDKERIYTGGVNIWTSSNGGTSWNLAAHWFGGGGAPYVHADIHDLEYSPSGQLWTGNDGGISSKDENSNNWSDHNDGLNITQYYKIGSSANDTTRVIGGTQDNGTHLMTNAFSWDRVRGGDGMDCAIDSKNSNIMYSSVYYGQFRKSSNGGNNFNASFNLPPSGNGNWVTPFALDPKHPDTLYAGFSRVWRSYNGGVSFSAVSPSNLTGGANIDVLTVAPEHTNVIYIAEGNDLWRSDDRGSSWVNQSSSIPSSNSITYISVSYQNPMHVVITRSGYGNGQKVYQSFNGGSSWTNISGNLPNIPANCVTHVKDNSGGLYVGTDAGVYYRDKNMSNWVSFNTGLPNVIVNELEINYINNKLRAGTYGRGLWESDLFGSGSAPIADISAPSTACIGSTVQLLDGSSYKPLTWVWSISPSTGVSFVNGTSSSSQNPEVSFTSAGIYDISLRVTNDNGTDSTVQISAVSVGGLPLPYAQDFETQAGFDEWEKLVSNGGKLFTNANVAGNGGVKAPYVSFRNTSNFGDEVDLISPVFNFNGHDSVWLDFDYAYTSASNNNGDSLKVYAAGPCGGAWTLVASFGEDGSGNFVTRGAQASAFTPQLPTDWCGNLGFGDCKSVDLSAFAGMESVQIKLVAVSGGGNAIYLDNINVSGRANVMPTADFSSNQTVCAQRTLSFSDQSYGSPGLYEWTFTGGTPATSNARNPQVVYTTSGTFDVSLKITNALGSDSIGKTAYITVDADVPVSINLSKSTTSTLCVGDSLFVTANAINEGTNPLYDWYVNGALEATTTNGQFSFGNLTNGDIVYAVLTSSESCAFPQNAISDTIEADYFVPPTLSINSANSSCTDEPAFALAASPAGGTFSGPGVSGNMFDPSISGPGNHTVIYSYTDVNGCTTSTDAIIGVNSPAAITFTLRDFCIGEGAVLLNTGYPAGGVYSGPGVRSNYLFTDSITPGIYQMTYSYASIGCAPTSEMRTFILHPEPQQPVVMQQGDTLFATNTAAATGFQWYNGNSIIPGATQDFYVPQLNSDYSVVITDGNGCESVSDELSSNIGLDENDLLQSFDLYPNPVRNKLRLNAIMLNRGDVELELTSLTGKVVRKFKYNQVNTLDLEINVSDLAAGMYILNLKLNNGIVTRKFTRQ